MTPDFISALTAHPFDKIQFRNIVSLRTSENLFDDLSDDPAEQEMALQFEMEHKPAPYRSNTPIIDRPFEEADWANAIGFPFLHSTESRYSAGTFGVWYGGDNVETTVHETAYHWTKQFLEDAGMLRPDVAIERKVYTVNLRGLIVDLSPLIPDYPDIIHASSYAFTQSVGAHFSERKYPGLTTQSARCAGVISAVFEPDPLSNPKAHCYLTYRTTRKGVTVERENGREFMTI